MNTPKCCFTGHRPQSLPYLFDFTSEQSQLLRNVLRKEIINLITNENVLHFISGMAIGVDMLAAEIIIELKSEYPNIILEAAIPCENQSIKWNSQLRNKYDDILRQCDMRTLIQKNYTSDCMHKRNRYMVDSSDYVIAVWNGKPSGTGKTVRYAEERGKSVIIVTP